jgi:hypothetical protein
MRFSTLDLALEAQAAVAPLIKRVQRHDRKLAQQLRDATNSFLLNLGEGAHSDPGNRRSRYQTAAGSTSEVLVGLRGSVGFRLLQPRRARAGGSKARPLARFPLEADSLKRRPALRSSRRRAASSAHRMAAAASTSDRALAAQLRDPQEGRSDDATIRTYQAQDHRDARQANR